LSSENGEQLRRRGQDPVVLRKLVDATEVAHALREVPEPQRLAKHDAEQALHPQRRAVAAPADRGRVAEIGEGARLDVLKRIEHDER